MTRETTIDVNADTPLARAGRELLYAYVATITYLVILTVVLHA